MSKPITFLLVPALIVGASIGLSAQNCPTIIDCPHTIVTVCDFSNNDPAFWNAPNFSWSPALQSADLSEASADLNVEVLDDCPGIITVKYVLYLDLDGDNLAESAIRSDNSMPPGKMLFGNAFNPGLSGTDTIIFDNRAVPDSMKFQFTVERVPDAGFSTGVVRWHTASSPGLYVAPRLPEGKHTIVWTVYKNGVPVGTCDYVFRVKDCQAPVVECIGNWSTTMPPSDTLTLQVSDVLQYAVDNITPFAALKLSLRRAGTGVGFPVNGAGQPVTELKFTCPELGQQDIEVWARDLSGNDTNCLSSVVLFDFSGNCLPDGPAVVYARSIFGNLDTIHGIDFHLATLVDPNTPPITLMSTPLPNGCAELPDFDPYPSLDEVAILPRKNNDPLNGVSTLDLVQIHRHILGVQLFNKTWKYLAADANNSGSITTLDIVELRKLILGAYDTLPHSDSWRFVITDCALDSLQPFQSACPGNITFDPDAMPSNLSFWGIKIGDVNGTADPDSLRPADTDRSVVTFLIPDRQIEPGETADLPVYPSSPSDWLAGQWALRWDPEVLTCLEVLPGSLPGLDENGIRLTRGALTMNWFQAEPSRFFPDQPLFTLRVRAHSPLKTGSALQLDTRRMAAEVYAPSGNALPLALRFEPARATGFETTAVFAPQPNPGSGGAVFSFRRADAGRSSLELYDLAGNLIFRTETESDAGAGSLILPESANVPAGVYVWRVQVGQVTKTGRLVRL